ncbi:MAG: glycosyl hydrolase [Luteolibacter sp.]
MALEQVRFEKPLPLVALAAVSDGGETQPLTNRVSSDGMLVGKHAGRVDALRGFPRLARKNGQAHGPGGEGNVIDHFDRRALATYLKKFDEALGGRDIKSFRAYFNDSYEVDDAAGNSNATPEIFLQFQRLRGYDLHAHLPASSAKPPPTKTHVLCDYRETISDLLLEEFTEPWTAWAHRARCTHAQSGPWLAREHPRPLRRERHS